MLSIRQTFRKGPLPLLISCGLEKLGLLPAHPGLKKLQQTNNILSVLLCSHSATPASFFQELSPRFSLRKQRRAYIQAPSSTARAHLPPPPGVLLFLLSSH